MLSVSVMSGPVYQAAIPAWYWTSPCWQSKSEIARPWTVMSCGWSSSGPKPISTPAPIVFLTWIPLIVICEPLGMTMPLLRSHSPSMITAPDPAGLRVSGFEISICSW